MNFPESKDSDFTWKDFQARNNNELAAIIGNFVNRTAHFILTQFDGNVPETTGKYLSFADDWNNMTETGAIPDSFSDNDKALANSLKTGINAIISNYERFRFRDALTETMNIARAANKYFNDEEPWKTSKSDTELCAKSLFVCANLVHTLAVIFAPIIPFTSEKMYKVCNEPAITGTPYSNKLGNDLFASSLRMNVKQGAPFSKPELLFTKVEDSVVEKQVSMLGDMQNQNTASEKKDELNLITIDTFKQIQLRTATILEAENVPKSKKLIKLKVDTGNDVRQIVAGIAEHYKPEELVGKLVVVVVNLQPAKLMGIESNGMLLAANSPDGKLSIVSPLNTDIGTGAEVR
jgi:methionyl-tRNA synthetase